MTPQEMATFLESLTDEELSPTLAYQLLSNAKNFVERTEKLEICKKLDSSQTAAAGDTYSTLKSLPSDFRSLIKIDLDDLPYRAVRFEDQVRYRNVARRIFLDIRQNKFAPTGPVSKAGTWNIFYIYKTTDFSEANEDDATVCVWPEEFHLLIPFMAAKISQANIDADAIAFRMSVEQEREFERLLSALRIWDHDLKLASMNGQTGFHEDNPEDEVDIGELG